MILKRAKFFIEDYWLPLATGAVCGFIVGAFTPGVANYVWKAVVSALD